MKRFDLHGMRHEAVEEALRQYLNWAEPPFIIVTGRSDWMIRKTGLLLSEYGFAFERDACNPGIIIVQSEPYFILD